MKQQIIPSYADRPDVEVLVDTDHGPVWCPGELRTWTQHDDDTWTADVQYRLPGERSSRIDDFPANRVREDTVDRSTDGELTSERDVDG